MSADMGSIGSRERAMSSLRQPDCRVALTSARCSKLSIRLEKAGSDPAQGRALNPAGNPCRPLHLNEVRMRFLGAKRITALTFCPRRAGTRVRRNCVFARDVDSQSVVATDVREPG